MVAGVPKPTRPRSSHGLALRSPPSWRLGFGPPRSLARAILARLRRSSRRARSFRVRPEDEKGDPARRPNRLFAPPDQPEANAGAPVPALIEGVIPIPPLLTLRSRGALERLYSRERLSARENSRLAGASRSGVLNALDRFGIPLDKDRPARTGHVPFGFDFLNHRLVANNSERATIRMMQKERADGLSLREIVGLLNRAIIPTKQNGAWQANTVRKILAHA